MTERLRQREDELNRTLQEREEDMRLAIEERELQKMAALSQQDTQKDQIKQMYEDANQVRIKACS